MEYGLGARESELENMYMEGEVNLDNKLEAIDAIEIAGNVQRNSLRLDLNYFRGEVFEVSTSSPVDWSNVSYSLNPKLDQNCVTGEITTELSGYVRNKWLVNAELYYRIYDRNVLGTSHNIILLDMSLSRFLFGGRGNVQLQVHDLLTHT